jgi:meckelin
MIMPKPCINQRWLSKVSLKTLFVDRFYRNKLLQFVDLLSVSNISVIIFDELLHGYYIHGKSVHPHADTDMIDMNNNLMKEEVFSKQYSLILADLTLLKKDLSAQRGLNDSEDQMFEIFFTKELRTIYDKVFSVLIAQVSKSNEDW